MNKKYTEHSWLQLCLVWWLLEKNPPDYWRASCSLFRKSRLPTYENPYHSCLNVCQFNFMWLKKSVSHLELLRKFIKFSPSQAHLYLTPCTHFFQILVWYFKLFTLIPKKEIKKKCRNTNYIAWQHPKYKIFQIEIFQEKKTCTKRRKYSILKIWGILIWEECKWLLTI